MSIPKISGLIWCKSWTGYGEGPYSIIAKLLMANALNPRYFAKVVRYANFEGVNLFNIFPCCRIAEENINLYELLQKATLGFRVPTIFKYITSYYSFRYCPICMNGGFQSTISQIVGLDECPIHCVPFLSTCWRCGAHTSPYRISESYPAPYFSCKVCKQPFGEKCNSHKDISIWAPPENLSSLHKIDDWLGSLEKKFNWVNIDWWVRCEPLSNGIGPIEPLILKVLHQFHPADFINIKSPGVDIFGPYAVNSERPEQQLTVDEYIQISSDLLPSVDVRSYWGNFHEISHGFSISMNARVPPLVHAIVIWRGQFEKLNVFRLPEENIPFLYPGAVEALLRGMYARVKDGPIGSDVKLGLLRATWTASLRIAENWHKMVLQQPRDSETNLKNYWTDVIRTWMPFLGRWLNYSQSPVGVVIENNEESNSRKAFYFFVS